MPRNYTRSTEALRRVVRLHYIYTNKAEYCHRSSSVYELLKRLNDLGLGCHIGHLSYAGSGDADDVGVVSLSVRALQQMPDEEVIVVCKINLLNRCASVHLNITAPVYNTSGADPGFLKGGGVQIRSTSKKGGARWGANFGPNVKKPTSCHKRGGPDPLDPPPLDPPLHMFFYALETVLHITIHTCTCTLCSTNKIRICLTQTTHHSAT